MADRMSDERVLKLGEWFAQQLIGSPDWKYLGEILTEIHRAREAEAFNLRSWEDSMLSFRADRAKIEKLEAEIAELKEWRDEVIESVLPQILKMGPVPKG